MKTVSMIALMAALVIAGCSDTENTNADGTLDTVGAGLERGASKVGEKIEAAAEDVRQELKETKIQAVLDNMKGMEGVDVELTDSGSITLVGTVADDAHRMEAERLVRGIKGVDSVVNALQVQGNGGAAPDTTTGDTL